MLGLGATDAKGRVGQLKGTGLVLERVYVPQASKPSRVALQQHGGTGEQSVQFVQSLKACDPCLPLLAFLTDGGIMQLDSGVSCTT